MNIPKELLYTPAHEWVKILNGTIRVGITDFAQKELTDIVFVELPPVNKEVTKGKVCAVVESVKTAADIYAPVSGKIIAVNEKVMEGPELVNTDPYGEGWLFEILMKDPSEVEALLSPEDYSKKLGEE